MLFEKVIGRKIMIKKWHVQSYGFLMALVNGIKTHNPPFSIVVAIDE